jgi:hypothetical protein
MFAPPFAPSERLAGAVWKLNLREGQPSLDEAGIAKVTRHPEQPVEHQLTE